MTTEHIYALVADIQSREESRRLINISRDRIIFDEVYYKGAWVKRADLPKIKKAENMARLVNKKTGFNKYRGWQ